MEFTLWMSVIPRVPMAALSLVFDGPDTIIRSLRDAMSLDARAVAAVVALLFIALVCTVLGTGGWASLLVRYPPQTVAPMSMLVPVIGAASSAAVLGERLDGTTLMAAVVILAGPLVITTR